MTLPPPPARASRPEPSGTGTDARAQASAAALDRHAARLRRPRIVYFAIVGVVVVGLVVFAAVAYSRGEVAHTTLHTVAHPPPSLAPASPDPAPQLRWHTGDTLAAGTPYSGGTVVTYSTHTVRGRDARTGRPTWSYTRTDRRVCNAVQIGTTTISVYAVHGDCDEVTALDTGTGKRVWSRTLDEDGVTLNGAASYRWTVDTILIWSAGAMYAIDPSSGLDRWTYRRYGCAIENAVHRLGGRADQPGLHASAVHGREVLRRAGSNWCCVTARASKADESKPNFDQFIWNDLGDSDVPVSAGTVVSALNRTTGDLDTSGRLTADRCAASRSARRSTSTATSTSASASATGLDTAEGTPGVGRRAGRRRPAECRPARLVRVDAGSAHRDQQRRSAAAVHRDDRGTGARRGGRTVRSRRSGDRAGSPCRD